MKNCDIITCGLTFLALDAYARSLTGPHVQHDGHNDGPTPDPDPMPMPMMMMPMWFNQNVNVTYLIASVYSTSVGGYILGLICTFALAVGLEALVHFRQYFQTKAQIDVLTNLVKHHR